MTRTPTTTGRLFVLGALAMVVSIGACSQPHLGKDYAQAYNDWFRAQHVNKQPANPAGAREVIDSLDAGEAANVTRSYRASTSKGTDTGGSRILMVGPQRGASDAYMPPPSVPAGQ